MIDHEQPQSRDFVDSICSCLCLIVRIGALHVQQLTRCEVVVGADLRLEMLGTSLVLGEVGLSGLGFRGTGLGNELATALGRKPKMFVAATTTDDWLVSLPC